MQWMCADTWHTNTPTQAATRVNIDDLASLYLWPISWWIKFGINFSDLRNCYWYISILLWCMFYNFLRYYPRSNSECEEYQIRSFVSLYLLSSLRQCSAIHGAGALGICACRICFHYRCCKMIGDTFIKNILPISHATIEVLINCAWYCVSRWQHIFWACLHYHLLRIWVNTYS